MRVAFITVGETDRLTGGHLYNARLLRGLRAQGVEVEEVVACGASCEDQKRAALQFGSRLDLRRFDVVLVDALARIVCAPHVDRWREARPVVALVHELPSASSGRAAARDRELEQPLLRADLLVAVSRHGGSILRDRGVTEERIRVVLPGSDRLSSEAGRPTPDRGGARLCALCVAQWIPRKGILELVRAWTDRPRPEATLIFVGETEADPGYAASVRAEIPAASGGEIVVSGPVDNATLARAYAEADLFVLPSHYEGYGIVYAEALSCGLPVIACEVGPVPELVGKDAALLVPPGDTAALRRALDLLLSDPGLRAEMSEAARERAESLPRWSETVSGIRLVLREVVSSGAPRGRWFQGGPERLQTTRLLQGPGPDETAEAEWCAELRERLERAYLATENPYRQSGMDADAARWERGRRPVVAAINRDGTFLDVGCANGLLMETLAVWAGETGYSIEPHGLDFSPALARLARRRLPRWADRIYVGNVMDWHPPFPFDFVRANLELVPPYRQRELVERLLEKYLAPGGRLIVCAYGSSRRPRPGTAPVGEILRWWGCVVAGEAEATDANGVIFTRVAWVDAP